MTYFLLNILTKETPRFWFQFWTDFNRFVLLLQECFELHKFSTFTLFPYLNLIMSKS